MTFDDPFAGMFTFPNELPPADCIGVIGQLLPGYVLNPRGSNRGPRNGAFEMTSPYDPRSNYASRCWCPGGGLGMSCCSLDISLGGHFKRIDCPTDYGTCAQLY